MDLNTFVTECLQKYEVKPLPDGEWWEEAHHPVPACLGGQETVRLWRSDHVIHGLLQSEQFDHPCLFGDGEEFVPNEYKILFQKWRKKLAQHGQRGLSHGDLVKGYHAMEQSMTSETEKLRRQRATETLLSQRPNHYSDIAKKARSTETPEQRSARGHAIPEEAKARGRAKINSRKFRCLVTGKVMPAGPLSAYQKRHGIDTSLREEVTSTQPTLY